MMFRNVPPVSSDMAGNEKCPRPTPGIFRKEDHRSKWRIFQQTMELITRGVAWWATFSSFQVAGLRIVTIVFCDNYIYISFQYDQWRKKLYICHLDPSCLLCHHIISQTTSWYAWDLGLMLDASNYRWGDRLPLKQG